MPKFTDRLLHAWNAFNYKEQQENSTGYYPRSLTSPGYSVRPDRTRMSMGNERSIVTALYNRIAIDVAAIKVEHVKVDHNGMFVDHVKSDLNYCITQEANIDQTGRAFFHDAILSMFDEGVVALVPTDTVENPTLDSDAYKILELRTGRVKEWFADKVRVEVYNEQKAMKEEVLLPKKMVAIIENPLYSVMNEPNSTVKRLIYKLNLLDRLDSDATSGKMDLIVQLPYTVRTDVKREEAQKRLKDVEAQLTGSKYGIAYIDATERVTQLNRPVENNLLSQIEYLSKLVYSQLGITENVLNGTASEQEMLNYYNTTIEPILSAFTDEMNRKFLTKTARSQGQRVMFFKDQFRLVPTEKIADIADKFTRNAILSSNELRAIIGYNPVDDVRADELSNKNLNQSNEELGQPPLTTDGAGAQSPMQGQTAPEGENYEQMLQRGKAIVDKLFSR